MDAVNNPAGRLWSFMNVLYTSADNVPAVRVWADYLGVDQNDPSAYFSAAAEVVRLPDQIAEAMEVANVPDKVKGKVLACLPAARGTLLFLSNVGVAVGQAKQSFGPTYLHALEIADAILDGDYPAAPEDDQIERLRDLAQELVDELRLDNGELDPQLRRALYETAAGFLRAVDLYKIAGVEGIREEWQNLFARVVFDADTRERLKKKPDVLAKIRDIALIVSTVASFTLNSVQVAQGIELLAIDSPSATHSSPAKP